MMMAGASKAGRNVAAKGAANIGSLKVKSTSPTGNAAGLEAGRGAVIQPNSSGYGKVGNRQSLGVAPTRGDMRVRDPFRGARDRNSISSYRRLEHWTKADRELSKRLT